MVTRPNRNSSMIHRRPFLQSIIGLGILTGISTHAAGAASSGRKILGSFENGLDGWRAIGRAKLSRVSSEERPFVIAEGDHALSVDPRNSFDTLIENKERVSGNNFVDNPYLAGRISTTYSEEYRSVKLILRYHHRATPARTERNGNGNKGKKGQDQSGNKNLKGPGDNSPFVEEKKLTIPLGASSTFSWDLSQLSDEKLSTPERLQIGWYPIDSQTEKHGNGKKRTKGGVGKVFFDAIAMTDSVGTLEGAAMRNHIDQLEANHGSYEYESRGFPEDGEVGEFIFVDGTAADVKWEDIGPNKEKMTIGGQTFKLGGGWE